jgi:hypothetical protein
MDNVLIAKDGFVYSNGKTYSNIIRLGVNDSADNWYEVPEEEVQIVDEQQENTATEEDYQNALAELGVDLDA